jgi:hypothetical protein
MTAAVPPKALEGQKQLHVFVLYHQFLISSLDMRSEIFPQPNTLK